MYVTFSLNTDSLTLHDPEASDALREEFAMEVAQEIAGELHHRAEREELCPVMPRVSVQPGDIVDGCQTYEGTILLDIDMHDQARAVCEQLVSAEDALTGVAYAS